MSVSLKFTNATAVPLRLLAQDATLRADQHSKDWSEPAFVSVLQSGAATEVQLTEIRRLVIETDSDSDVALPLANSSLFNALRVSTQAKDGKKGFGAPAHLTFLHPQRSGGFGRPGDAFEANISLSATRRLIVEALPT